MMAGTALKPAFWLRTAAVIALLFAAGHTAGRPWTPARGPAAQSVVDAMRGVQFQAASATRSYWDFYQGFGLIVSLFLALEAILLWQLALSARRGLDYRAGAVTHLVAFLVVGLVGARYVFALPVWFALAIAACLVLACIAGGARSA